MKRKEQINSFAVDKLLGLGPAFSESEIQYNNGYMRGLMEGAEWADETMIDNVCEYLKTLVYQEYSGGPLVRQIDDEQLEKLRKVMKGE